MPLIPGSSERAMSSHLGELLRPKKQAIAVALSERARHPLGQISFENVEHQDPYGDRKNPLGSFPGLRGLITRSVGG